MGKKKDNNNTILSYALRFDSKFKPGLRFLSRNMTRHVNLLWHDSHLCSFLLNDNRQFVYKSLEAYKANNYNQYFPSRVKRSMLETEGRVLRSQIDKQELFNSLVKLSDKPKEWTFDFLKKHGLYKKRQYINNIRRQVTGFIKNNKRLPENYQELVPNFRIGNFITLAPDDNQFIKYNCIDKSLSGQMKTYVEEEKKWKWLPFETLIPDHVLQKTEKGKVRKPDIRMDKDGNIFLDFKVEVKNCEHVENNRILCVDYGLNTLLTFTCFEIEDGKPVQISRPYFFKVEGIQKKIERIYQEIDKIKTKISNSKDKRKIKVLKREQKSKWKKIKKLSKELEHLSSNIVLEFAQIFGCSVIVIEDLKGMNGKPYCKQLNKRLYRTIRARLFEKLKYKASIKGIKVKEVFAAYTSKSCPKCGGKGSHPTYGQFKCPKCTYSANRDFVATQNIARRYLKISLNDATQIGYKPGRVKDTVNLEGSFYRIKKWLNAWKDCIEITPISNKQKKLKPILKSG